MCARLLLLVVLCFAWSCVGVAAPPPAESDGFVALFDGRTLDGWVRRGGGATYAVEDGCIVGRVGPSPNTFLCTTKDYADFILKVEFKFDVPGNSGIQVRSHFRSEQPRKSQPKKADKKEKKDEKAKKSDAKPDAAKKPAPSKQPEPAAPPAVVERVFGYQVEIDPSPRAWSGGIYDEGRRGWLNNLLENEPARKAYKSDGWNQYVIRCVGPHIETWINGVPAADLLDCLDLDGFIGLQVHQGAKGQIRWRNIQIKELGRTQWSPLWNGRDLTGWASIGGGKWEVVDGVLHGTAAKESKEHGLLITNKTYADFAVRLKYKANQGNSGLYFRCEKGGSAGVLGFQAEIDPAKDAGGLYETGGRAWVVQPKPDDVKKWFKPGQWNEMSVIAVGRRVAVHVNGFKSAELNDDPGRTAGNIALQLHGGQDMDVEFKDVEVIDLKK